MRLMAGPAHLPMWWDPIGDALRGIAKALAEAVASMWTAMVDIVTKVGYVDFGSTWFLIAYGFMFAISLIVSALVLMMIMIRVSGGHASPSSMWEAMSGRFAVFFFGAMFGPYLGLRIQDALGSMNQTILDWRVNSIAEECQIQGVACDTDSRVKEVLVDELGTGDAFKSVMLSIIFALVTVIVLMLLFVLVTFLKLGCLIIMIFLPLFLALYVSKMYSGLVKKAIMTMVLLFLAIPLSLFFLAVGQLAMIGIFGVDGEGQAVAVQISNLIMVLLAMAAPCWGTLAVLNHLRRPQEGGIPNTGVKDSPDKSAPLGSRNGAQAALQSNAAAEKLTKRQMVASSLQAKHPRLMGAMSRTGSVARSTARYTGAAAAAKGVKATAHGTKKAAVVGMENAQRIQSYNQSKLRGAMSWSAMGRQELAADRSLENRP